MIHFEAFARESNAIEGIWRPVSLKEVGIHEWFSGLEEVSVEDLEQFVAVVQPGAVLRDKIGHNVVVGNHVAPAGGPYIRPALAQLLGRRDLSPYERHQMYLNLHPFTDGNGRSARVLWLWEMGEAPIGFLHEYYYQSLEAADARHQ